MIYIRGLREDYDHWAAAGNPAGRSTTCCRTSARPSTTSAAPTRGTAAGGPLNVMDLRSPHRFGALFVEARRQAAIRQSGLQRRRSEGVGTVQVTHEERRALQRREGLPDAAPRAARTCVMTGAHTTRIVIEGRRAVGVEVRRRRPQTIGAAREVLLCAGALQSPQVLHAVGHRRRRALQRIGIEPAITCPASAPHLHDHVDVVQVVDAPHLKDLFGLVAAGAGRVLAGIVDWRRRAAAC
jgi:choline dehydrogenase-like flavoprotein